MSSSGDQLVAGRIPGERIATTERTASVGTFTTTETISDSVTFPAVAGRTYAIRLEGTLMSSVANDSVNVALREDNVSGTRHVVTRVSTPVASAGFGYSLYTEWTAGSTGNKTFVGTGDRVSGTGNITMTASATQKSYIFVEYISG